MATRPAVLRYARQCLAESPGLTETELRARLEWRFLARGAEGTEAAAAAGGILHGARAPAMSEAGCLAMLFLAPLVFLWRLVFPVKPTDPAVIDGVLDEVRGEYRRAT